MFLKGNSPRNLITALKFHQLKGLLMYAQNMENIDFGIFLL